MRAVRTTAFAVLMTAAALFALTGYQVTSRTAATRLLGRLAATLVEIDRWLPSHQDDIELLARDKPQSQLGLSDLPIDVSLQASQIIDLAGREDALRALIVSRMGVALYEDGTGAFRDEQGGQRSLSITEPVRWTVTLLEGSRRSFWEAVLLLSLLVALAAVAAVLLGGGSPLAPILIGAGLAATLSLTVWLLATAAQAAVENPVDKETMLILRDGAWIGLRDSLAVTVAAGSLLILLGPKRQQLRSSSSWPNLPSA